MSKIAIFLANGFEEIEGLTVVDICRRCGLTIDMVSITEEKQVMGSHKIPVTADMTLSQVNLRNMIVWYCPVAVWVRRIWRPVSPDAAARCFLCSRKIHCGNLCGTQYFRTQRNFEGEESVFLPLF